jgi:hypothetical protein
MSRYDFCSDSISVHNSPHIGNPKKGTPTMLPSTAERVRINTADPINWQIDRQIDRNVARYANASPQAINRRLAALDREWDVERYLETMAPSFTLAGLFLGVTASRKWLIVPAVVQSFFLQHALQGWCPPLPFLRRLGIRTAEEIHRERCALEALREDRKDRAALSKESVEAVR